MLHQSRPVHFRTIMELIKKRSMLLQMGAIFSLVGAAVGVIFLIVIPMLGHDVSEVDYRNISAIGEATTGTITDIERNSTLLLTINTHQSFHTNI